MANSLRFRDKNREIIIDFLRQGGDGPVELTDKQAELLTRWSYIDELIREQRYKRDVIATKAMQKFGITRNSAYLDIVNTEYVFSSSIPLNKRYLIQVRIEFIQKKIDDAYIDKNIDAAANLEKVLQGYIKLYPDYEPPRPPQTIIYNITNNNLTLNQLSPQEAFQNAEIVIKQLESDHDSNK